MSKRVFVVDDERCIADSLATILRMSGYDTTALYDGEAALSACNSHAPDLIISDVIMPGMSGIELAIRIKERYPGCKVLLFSGMAATSDLLEQARSQGHDFEVLAKPVHPTDLLAKLAA
jgi:CheY-like chemotaxis protein